MAPPPQPLHLNPSYLRPHPLLSTPQPSHNPPHMHPLFAPSHLSVRPLHSEPLCPLTPTPTPQVCTLCFRSGLPYCPPSITSQGINPGAAPRVLAAWLRGLQQGEALRALLLRLRATLEERVEGLGFGGGGGWAAAAATGGADVMEGEGEVMELLACGRQMVEEVQQLVGSLKIWVFFGFGVRAGRRLAVCGGMRKMMVEDVWRLADFWVLSARGWGGRKAWLIGAWGNGGGAVAGGFCGVVCVRKGRPSGSVVVPVMQPHSGPPLPCATNPSRFQALRVYPSLSPPLPASINATRAG